MRVGVDEWSATFAQPKSGNARHSHVRKTLRTYLMETLATQAGANSLLTRSLLWAPAPDAGYHLGEKSLLAEMQPGACRDTILSLRRCVH